MTLAESIRVALRSLSANKLRTLLTMLGMIIGVASVIAVMSIGRGTQASVTSRISEMGSNLVFVRPGSTTQGGVRTAQGTANTLTLQDADAIAASVPGVVAVAPESTTGGQVVAGPSNTNTSIYGVTEGYDVVRKYTVEYGEFVNFQQVQARSLVAVLGSAVAERLFPEADPIGQAIRINRTQFRVIGVLKSKGGSGAAFQDDLVMVPLTTLQTRLMTQRATGGQQTVSLINIQVASEREVDRVKADVADLLRERHRLFGEDDFTVTSQEDTLEALNQVATIFTLFLGSIAAISLVVGGIGIMNIMLVS
ncbi:MAG: ABC transporter permease, partial [Chloroflexi bacterium]|nr:ABC transporter permease [Chloroflexota bacterium]